MTAPWQLVRACAAITIIGAASVCAVAVGVVPKELTWSPRMMDWFAAREAYIHGWPFDFMKRRTERYLRSEYEWIIEPGHPPRLPSFYSSRFPIDRAKILSFSGPALIADTVIVSTIAAFAVAIVIAAARARHRVSATWAFMVATTAAGVVLAIHQEHADWVFLASRDLMPFDDLAIAVVLGVAILHAPGALVRATTSSRTGVEMTR